MKILVFILCLALGSNVVTAGQYSKGATRISLNGYWGFKTDPNDIGISQGWSAPGFNDTGWDKLAVPGSWELENETSKYIGKAWYSTRFNFSAASYAGKRKFIEFEAVSMSYQVFLNGKVVASVLSGNNAKKFDITELLADGENSLKVVVDNSLKWGAYVNWGGIRRSVSLIVVDPVYIIRQQVTATPDLKAGTASVKIEVFLSNGAKENRQVNCRPFIYFQGKLIYSGSLLALRIPPETTVVQTFSFNLPKAEVKLWHFDFPNLYTANIALYHDGQSDSYQEYQDRFGIRKIEIDGYQFKLNGEPVRLAGYNWVADDRTTGNTLPQWRYKEDIDLMKAAGANMARLSHRPLPQEVMDYLDEKGILIISEFSNYSKYLNQESQEPRDFATDLIQENFNHPSIIGWSVGNEMAGYNEHPQVKGYVESIIKYIRTTLDPTRFLLYVSNTADFQEDDPAKYCDFIMLNKYANYAKGVDAVHARFPDKAIFLSEYGEYGNTLIYDTPNNSKFKDLIVNQLMGREYLFGFALWTYNDYRSLYKSPLASSTTPIDENRRWGIVDVYRNKKRAYRQMQNQYAPVQALEVKTAKRTGNKITAELLVRPRPALSIPAFTLNGYYLVWELQSKAGKTQLMDFIELPEVRPGTATLSYPLSFELTAATAALKVSLVSPTGYTVKDTIISYARPQAPEIIEVIKAGLSVRVVLGKTSEHEEYMVKYGQGKLTGSTPSTIDHYINIDNLKPGVEYHFAAVAVNGSGESEPSAVQVLSPEVDYRPLPPVIWLTEPTDHGFYVGISADIFDSYYQVMYWDSPDGEDKAKTLLTSSYGMLKVSGLENGRQIYYKVRRITQQQSRESAWSETITVTPGSLPLAGRPKINGTKRNGTQLLVSCSLARNASGYQLSYRTRNKNIIKKINQVSFDYLILQVPAKEQISDIRIEPLLPEYISSEQSKQIQ